MTKIELVIFILPPQFVHFDTSIPNTLARSFAGELFFRREAFSFGSLFSCFSFSLIWALVSPGIITLLQPRHGPVRVKHRHGPELSEGQAISVHDPLTLVSLGGMTKNPRFTRGDDKISAQVGTREHG